MKIEKLNENKIRITLDLNDLREKNIDFHSFMSNSEDSQSLFLDMLEEAEKKVGFVTKDYKLMIEAIATSEGEFILTVTRALPESEKDILKKKKPRINRKSSKINKDIAIYEFYTFDDFCNFSLSMNKSLLLALKKPFSTSKLYLYNGKYYLVLTDIETEPQFIKKFCTYIAEFGFYIHNSSYFSKKLSEYGKIIMKKNAIQLCKKHFSQ